MILTNNKTIKNIKPHRSRRNENDSKPAEHGKLLIMFLESSKCLLTSNFASLITVIILIGLLLSPTMFGYAIFGSAQEDPTKVPQFEYSSNPPEEMRPKVVVNLADWVGKVSEDIRAVGERTSCVQSIRRAYDEWGKFYLMDMGKLRDYVISQINILLSQHRSAVDAIVTEAEISAMNHKYLKNFIINYTDVHRIRNELDPLPPQQMVLDPVTGQPKLQDQLLQESTGPAGSLGSSSGASGVPQFTSIGGGTPVPGAPEWQTPIKSIIMRVNKNFGDIPVNTSMSAVHLPLPIYPNQSDIMNGIGWSEKLDYVFKRNLLKFAHVHHQYYGDRLGFLRTFPAHKWRIPKLDPDLFDARTRPWYVAGSSSPKNVVIMIDSSGSMTGLRREIAKGVVFEILDTLTSSDYFTVMRFSESITPIGLPKCSPQNLKQPKLTLDMREQCNNMGRGQRSQMIEDECQIFERQIYQSSQYLRDHPEFILGKNGSYLTDDVYEKSIGNLTNEIRDAYMLQATSRNIRYLKSNFTMPTAGIANFTNALMGAFELLQAYQRTSNMGAQCNQAIMLITDGAIRSHEEIFNRYNYPNAPVRMFTYVIGREVGDIRPTKAMACINRGYYTHVINLSEVREQVLKYLPVMARPLVLAKHHPISWTPAYGDETHQVLTDWVLEIKRRERARIMLNEERERSGEAIVNIELTNIQEYDDLPQVDEALRNRIICEDNEPTETREMDLSMQEELDPLGHNELACHWTSRRADLLTSVVKPVFDQKNISLIYEPVFHKNTLTDKEVFVKNAQLLGVAAVDLRISDILKSIPSHQLGPNAYPILIGQNGFIMHHPDLRALLEDPFDRQSKILKPYFNAVDLTHIEQTYFNAEKPEDGANIQIIRNLSRPEIKRLVKLRENSIKGHAGNEKFWVKRAIDCRRRPHIREQAFFYGPIKETPFSLMIATPFSYGLNRIKATKELKPRETSRYFNPSAYELWTVHPEYRYCDGPGLANKDNSSVAKILEIMNLVDSNSIKNVHLNDLNAINANYSEHKIVCDSELFPALLFDASLISSNGPNSFCPRSSDDSCYKSSSSSSSYFFPKNPFSDSGTNPNDDLCTKDPDEMRVKLANIYGLEMSFLATRSGLTRVRVFDLSPRIKRLADVFIQRHNRAIDESWYSRTVDWNLRFSEDSTIITVPYNAYVRLIAKLRQRITQRHPAVNNTLSNCDPKLDEPEDASGSDLPTTSSSLSPVSEGGVAPETPPPPSSDQPSLTSEEAPLSIAPTEVQSEPTGRTGADLADRTIQNDEPASGESASSASSASEGAENTNANNSIPNIPKIDYSAFTTYDFLDMLTNSSVHISATQTVVAGGAKQRTPMAVTGLLYDYATFARRFLNATSLNIRNLDKEAGTDQVNGQQVKVDVCPNGECPTKCGFRNDTIDCMLVDNNGFIVVGEELPYIGRSLTNYDERLMQSLVEKKIFYQISLIDYQAICTRSAEQVAADQRAAAAASSPQQLPSASSSSLSKNFKLSMSLNMVTSALANLASSIKYTASVLYSLLLFRASIDDFKWIDGEPFYLRDFFVGAQMSQSNQSVLSLLPNKTYLRACEKIVQLYETQPTKLVNDKQSGETNRKQQKMSVQEPVYYQSRCNCSAWYVIEPVPKTNLLMLIVNTTSSCRRCEQAPFGDQNANTIPLSGIPTTTTTTTTTLPNPITTFGELNQNNNIPTSLIPNIPAQNGINLSPNNQASSSSPLTGNRNSEEQVCAMLERDSSLYIPRTPQNACYSFHEKELEIPLCGRASATTTSNLLLAISAALWLLLNIFT